MKEFETIGLYTELDAILDTRIALLYQHYPEETIRLLSESYFDRIADDFSFLPAEDFRTLYQSRSNETLKHAMVTTAISFINVFKTKTLMALVDSPYQRQPMVTINTFPYTIPESTLGALITAIRKLTDDGIDIDIIHEPRENITPDFIKRKYAFMMMYDYWDWLEIHSLNENFKKTQIPAVTLFGPAILKSIKTHRELSAINPFDAIEKFCSPMVKVSLYPVSKFSIDVSSAARFHAK